MVNLDLSATCSQFTASNIAFLAVIPTESYEKLFSLSMRINDVNKYAASVGTSLVLMVIIDSSTRVDLIDADSEDSKQISVTATKPYSFVFQDKS